jgi:peroxiredoxin
MASGVLALSCLACFPKKPGLRLQHFATSAPEVGSLAPDFELLDVSGLPVRLSDLLGEKPIVLQFGSHSCPVYRYRRFSVRELYDDLGERAHFLFIYTLEAHPVGSKSPYSEKEWDTWWNRLAGVRVQQPGDLEERRELARFSTEQMEVDARVLVDGLDNAVWKAYGAASSPAFVIDQEGRVAARYVWIEPKRIKEAILSLLEEDGREE